MGARVTGGGFSRRRRIALAVALVLLLALVALWLLRKPIAEHYVDRTLAATKVPARYTIADLGLGRQRLTNVVIGDPRAPDLVADWIETRTRIGARGPELAGVRAGRLRVRGRLVDGRLSLGAIDRLLPASSGGPLALPRLDLAVEDGRMRLETPYGVAGLAISGSGRLDGGFAGRVAVVAERLATATCGAERVAGAMQVRTTRARAGTQVALDGPLRAGGIACGGAAVARWTSDVAATLTLGERLAWTMRTQFASGAVTHPQARARSAEGEVALGGETGSARGTLAVQLAGATAAQGSARELAVRGPLAIDGGGVSLGEGARATATLRGARVAPAMLARAEALSGAGAGTPIGPLLAAAVRAGRAAAAGFDATATLGVVADRADGEASLASATVRAASGARVDWAGRAGWAWGRDAGPAADGRLRMAGGGLPTATVRWTEAPGVARRINVAMQPYAAGGARLALAPVTIAGNRVMTRATLSGPLGDGRVEGLTLPLDLRMEAGGVVANAGCTPVGFESLRVAGLVLEPARLRLCPTGAALVRVADGRIAGGARLGTTRLGGRLGSTPVEVAVAGATIDLTERGFVLDAVRARLGAPDRVTRIDAARLDGRITGGGVAGRFSGAGGQIGAVPLLLADAAGQWGFAQGVLVVGGGLTVSDAQASAPRFKPMQGREVVLRLAEGRIAATGGLYEPTTGTRVAAVALIHDLGAGTGAADLQVRDLAFTKAFQPTLLTPLTLGVVADVAGTVAGTGHIAWSPAGVTSTGEFRTEGLDLAAAFGPVTGIAGTLRFTDLLGLTSAAGQVATVKAINPGIVVSDGVVRYQLLPDTRVKVEGGAWPFAGGRLVLDPALLDFGQDVARRMTFRVEGVAADRFLQQFDFKNLDATGTFDGTLPMVFDASGGRIEKGFMTVREGGGSIAYNGELTEKQLGFWGDFAFQALRSLRYRSLSLAMNGPLAGEMVTDVRFAGIRQGEGAKSNFLIRRLQKLPLVFNVRIKAPFRGLIDSAQSFYDPSRLIQRNLPTLLDEAGKPTPPAGPASIQPPASPRVPQKD